MKPKLKVLFYGMTHEHAPGKFETLKKLTDVFEVIAVVDDRPRNSPMYRDRTYPMPDYERYPIIGENEVDRFIASHRPDVVFVEVTNCDLMEIAGKFAARHTYALRQTVRRSDGAVPHDRGRVPQTQSAVPDRLHVPR